jgi:hypothetical protein
MGVLEDLFKLFVLLVVENEELLEIFEMVWGVPEVGHGDEWRETGVEWTLLGAYGTRTG